jgi:RNA polymerase sigma factor (sigma-70 family)
VSRPGRGPAPAAARDEADPPITALLERAASGDASAWEAVVDRHASLVWAVAKRHRLSDADAEDVSQTVWLRLVEHLPQLREPRALVGWLATTTHHECLRVLRRADRQVPLDTGELDLHDLALQHGAAGGTDEALLAGERAQALREGFAQLPENCRRLLALLVTDPEPSYGQVSERLRMPVGSIGPTRRRCLERLRRCPAIVALTGGDELRTDG